MIALIDADILRYEIGHGAVTGWKTITEGEEEIPPFDYVQQLLHEKVDNITAMAGADSYKLFLTTGRSFRYDIATVRPYKGNRDELTKPYHFDNLSQYIIHNMPTHLCDGAYEADDELAIIHRELNLAAEYPQSVICSRDKDLRQVPGMFYCWELGYQASFGPHLITTEGSLELSDDRKKLTGTGFPWFAAQCLIGDVTDNIPGLPKCGPVKAYSILQGHSPEDCIEAVKEAYDNTYQREGYDRFLEQARLVWLVRERGAPLWEPGVYE